MDRRLSTSRFKLIQESHASPYSSRYSPARIRCTKALESMVLRAGLFRRTLVCGERSFGQAPTSFVQSLCKIKIRAAFYVAAEGKNGQIVKFVIPMTRCNAAARRGQSISNSDS